MGGLLRIQFHLTEQYPCFAVSSKHSLVTSFVYVEIHSGFPRKQTQTCQVLDYRRKHWKLPFLAISLKDKKKESEKQRIVERDHCKLKVLEKGKSNSREVGLTLQEANFTVKVNRAFLSLGFFLTKRGIIWENEGSTDFGNKRHRFNHFQHQSA